MLGSLCDAPHEAGCPWRAPRSLRSLMLPTDLNQRDELPALLKAIGGQIITERPGDHIRSARACDVLLATEILVNAVWPGWVATDMGGSGGRPVAEGAAGIVWATTLPDDGPSGGFFRDGKPLPW